MFGTLPTGTIARDQSFPNMPYMVEILLPVTHTRRTRANLDRVRDELAEKFGGATLHVNSPAEGVWENGDDVEQDLIVVAEVMVDDLDRSWWASYRGKLEARFRQKEIVVRSSQIERL